MQRFPYTLLMSFRQQRISTGCWKYNVYWAFKVSFPRAEYFWDYYGLKWTSTECHVLSGWIFLVYKWEKRGATKSSKDKAEFWLVNFPKTILSSLQIICLHERFTVLHRTSGIIFKTKKIHLISTLAFLSNWMIPVFQIKFSCLEYLH